MIDLFLDKWRVLAPQIRCIDGEGFVTYPKAESADFIYRLHLLDRFFGICLTDIDPVLIRIIPRSRYPFLNSRVSSHIHFVPLRGSTGNELVSLTYRMYERGCGLLGDVVQMSSADIAAHAVTIPSIRNPIKIVAQLEKVLDSVDLCLNMRAPGWERSSAPSLESLIADRDVERSIRPRAARGRPHLSLVGPKP